MLIIGCDFHTRCQQIAMAEDATGELLLERRLDHESGEASVFYRSLPAPVRVGIEATGQQGDFGRNVLRGFGAWQADLALQRQFHLTERMGLRFRAEFFNIFNHPNFGSPTNTLRSALFGKSTQTLASSLGSGGANGGFNPLYQIGGPRSIQLALKFLF